mmetsp:Transcript_4083/g.9682  ORF Transcript_4083/g.9682 Transcript_4083/m.9682 type:complete len:227 (+) Transcript_4083:1457-2137(+)
MAGVDPNPFRGAGFAPAVVGADPVASLLPPPSPGKASLLARSEILSLRPVPAWRVFCRSSGGCSSASSAFFFAVSACAAILSMICRCISSSCSFFNSSGDLGLGVTSSAVSSPFSPLVAVSAAAASFALVSDVSSDFSGLAFSSGAGFFSSLPLSCCGTSSAFLALSSSRFRSRSRSLSFSLSRSRRSRSRRSRSWRSRSRSSRCRRSRSRLSRSRTLESDLDFDL